MVRARNQGLDSMKMRFTSSESPSAMAPMLRCMLNDCSSWLITRCFQAGVVDSSKCSVSSDKEELTGTWGVWGLRVRA